MRAAVREITLLLLFLGGTWAFVKNRPQDASAFYLQAVAMKLLWGMP